MSDKLFEISLKGDLMLRLYELAQKYRGYDASQEAIIEFALDYAEDDEDFHQFLRKKLWQESIRRTAEEARAKKAQKEALKKLEDKYHNKLNKLETERRSNLISDDEYNEQIREALNEHLRCIFLHFEE